MTVSGRGTPEKTGGVEPDLKKRGFERAPLDWLQRRQALVKFSKLKMSPPLTRLCMWST
jgi:hypothetical protein